MPTSLPITDRLDGIASDLSSALTVANTATGASDTNVSDAIDRLAQYYRPNALEWNMVTISNASSIETAQDLAETVVSSAEAQHTYMFVLITPPTGGQYTNNQVFGCTFYQASSSTMTGGGMIYNNGLVGFDDMSTSCAVTNGDVYGWMEIKDNVFPNLRRVYTMSEDGQTLLSTYVCEEGTSVTYDGVTPTKPDSGMYEYTFDGWSTMIGGAKNTNALTNVTADRAVYAHFAESMKKLHVQFRNKSSGTDVLLDEVEVDYGGTATYTGTTPVYGGVLSSDWGFWRWNPSNANITEDTVCYAEFDNLNTPLEKYMAGNLVKYESETNNYLHSYAFASQAKLELVHLATSDPVTIDNYAFNGCSKLESVIIHSDSVGTLNSRQSFNSSKINTGYGGIYVKDSIVNDYKSATNWSFYNIYPISSYPVSTYDTITDTWDEIAEAESDGTYLTKYHIGDTKSLTFSTSASATKTLHMRIIGFNKDTITNGNGATAKITWSCLIGSPTQKMNATNTSSGGWPDSSLRSYLQTTVYPSFPSELKSLIKTVDKTYYDVGTTSTKTSSDYIWLLSEREVNFTSTTTTTESSGPIYDDVFSTNATRQLNDTNGNALNTAIWLRTAADASKFVFIYGNGTRSTANASNGYAPIFCFCT